MDRPKCDTTTGQAKYILFFHVGSFGEEMESTCENCHLNYEIFVFATWRKKCVL